MGTVPTFMVWKMAFPRNKIDCYAWKLIQLSKLLYYSWMLSPNEAENWIIEI